jgi:hypothetical protein
VQRAEKRFGQRQVDALIIDTAHGHTQELVNVEKK